MKVELLSCTPDALTLLLRTKNTRLAGGGDPAKWSEEERAKNLAYMRDTIRSSWEFCDFTFQISDVSRAFTHELVRHRHGSYAQESQRAVDVRNKGWNALASGTAKQREHHDVMMRSAVTAYTLEVDDGIPLQEARELLPTGLHTAIIAKFSLRALAEMAEIRLCTRAAGEFQEVVREIKKRVLEVYPFFEPFIRVGCAVDGICRFPRYTLCPIQKETFNALPGYKDRVEKIAALAEKTRHVANPKATSGKTM